MLEKSNLQGSHHEGIANWEARQIMFTRKSDDVVVGYYRPSVTYTDCKSLVGKSWSQTKFSFTGLIQYFYDNFLSNVTIVIYDMLRYFSRER